MRIDVTKTLIQGLIAAIAAVAVATQAAPGKSQGSGGWEASADHVESAVVSIKFSPVAEAEVDGDVVLVPDEEGTEAACVAVQIAMNLLKTELEDREGVVVEVPPADRVSLFLTLGGVETVGPDILEADPAPMCLTPEGMKPLTGLINAFEALENTEIVVCPLCWTTRYCEFDDEGNIVSCEAPNVGTIADAVDIHDLFLEADKVIDF